MAKPLNWKSAFLEQSNSDFEIYLKMKRLKGIPDCHKLHYLWMAIEKLLKYFKSDALFPIKPTHKVADFINETKRYSSLIAHFGLRTQNDFDKYIDETKQIVKVLENLIPGNEFHKNIEYPWEERTLTPNGDIAVEICIPALQAWNEIAPKKLKQIEEFVKKCLELPV